MKARPVSPPLESKSYARSPTCSSMSTPPSARGALGMPSRMSRATHGMHVDEPAGIDMDEPRSP
eukprot:2280790-Prymnesium_polylepis.2